MVKQHIIRIAAPKTWPILKKANKFITRPLPAGHKLDNGISLNTALKEMIKIVKTSKDVKKILNNGEVMIDQKKKKEPKHTIGLMDVLSIPKIKKSWRMLISTKGKLLLNEIEEKESKIKLCKISNKTKIKKDKIQLNLHDGRNLIVDKDDYKTNDTIIISVPDQKITGHIKLEKGVTALLIGGKKAGIVCKIDEITKNMITATKDGETFETLKSFAFAIGKDKSEIKID